MPVLSFGLNLPKGKAVLPTAGQKRKNLFTDGDDNSDEDPDSNAPSEGKAVTLDLVNDDETLHRARKSPKLDASKPILPMSAAAAGRKYTNLASLRSARLQDAQASELDSSVYEYDAVYDSFHASKKPISTSGDPDSGPKYLTSLLASADVRKRDQLRAREKVLQREREAEGDEFADKEKFVTGAYKAQQEEVRRVEEEEARKAAEEEERRRRGQGMLGFHRDLLRKEDERTKAIEEASRKRLEEEPRLDEAAPEEEEESEARLAAELNEKGAHIVVNDEGEVVDKRQLLSAGLNITRKPKTKQSQQPAADASTSRPSEYYRSSTAQNAREAQRQRQTRMIEQQIEQMAAQAKVEEDAEIRAQEDKAKSRKTQAEIGSARERYLARKREKEEQAKKKTEG